MRVINILFILVFTWSVSAQEVRLKKGVVMTNLIVNDTLSESFSLYLPSLFDANKASSVLFVSDLKGRSRQALSMFVAAAEKENFILAASDNLRDSLSITKNILISNRLFSKVYSLLLIKKEGVYVGGYKEGAKFSSLIPSFVKGVSGVISCSASIANRELLNVKKAYSFIGIVGKEDFVYPDMLSNQKFLNKLRYPNYLLVHNGGAEWPESSYLSKALKYFKLIQMAKMPLKEGDSFVQEKYKEGVEEVRTLLVQNEPLLAESRLVELLKLYRPLRNIDSLNIYRKQLRRSRLFRSRNNEEKAALLKESFVIGEYDYYLEEDVTSYNYNNLGWWQYQTEEISKLKKSVKQAERQLGKRLDGYLNALVEDYIDITNAEKVVDEDALSLLYMVKTILAPKDYTYYLKVISLSSKKEDYGTALFYLEELLKNGYVNKDELYSVEHTALFRITPEFNTTIAKYLSEARYDILEE